MIELKLLKIALLVYVFCHLSIIQLNTGLPLVYVSIGILAMWYMVKLSIYIRNNYWSKTVIKYENTIK